MGVRPAGRRRLVLLALAVAVLAVAAGAGATAMDAGDDEPSAKELLNDTRERYAAAESLVTTADVTVSNGSANTTATVEFATAENSSRVVVTRGNATYRAGTNGTVVWYAGPNRTVAYERDALRERLAAYNGSRNATNVSVAPTLASPRGNATDPGRLVNESVDLADRVDAEIVRTGEDDGLEAHVVRLTPNTSALDASSALDVRATLWIATDDPRLLRAVVTDGTNTTVVDYTETRFGASVHRSTFDPPRDRVAVTTFDRYATFDAARANTSLDLPELDATFDAAGVLQRSEGTLVAQRYRADGDNVTVVSTTFDRGAVSEYVTGNATDATNATVDGREATLATARNATAVYWRADGVTTAVIVEADADRAIELARQLDDQENRSRASRSARLTPPSR
jgi:outer membrane lipoprotein-sorting protein